MATDTQIEEWLMQGYGYRKTTELRGELIFENHQIVRDTLHTEEVYVRDLVQPAPPMNEPNCDTCDACGGDGGFDDTYIDTSHEVTSDWHRCERCDGTGVLWND